MSYEFDDQAIDPYAYYGDVYDTGDGDDYDDDYEYDYDDDYDDDYEEDDDDDCEEDDDSGDLFDDTDDDDDLFDDDPYCDDDEYDVLNGNGVAISAALDFYDAIWSTNDELRNIEVDRDSVTHVLNRIYR